MAKKKGKAGANGKAPKLDLTKPVKIPSASGLRSKSEVFNTIAEKVGISRRDVARIS